LIVEFKLELGLSLDLANLQLGSVLLEDVLAVVLPELLGGILAGDALQDAGAARVLVEELCYRLISTNNLSAVKVDRPVR